MWSRHSSIKVLNCFSKTHAKGFGQFASPGLGLSQTSLFQHQGHEGYVQTSHFSPFELTLYSHALATHSPAVRRAQQSYGALATMRASYLLAQHNLTDPR
jgi:hypothetical protein